MVRAMGRDGGEMPNDGRRVDSADEVPRRKRPLAARMARWVVGESGPWLIIAGTAALMMGALPVGPFAAPDWEAGVPAARFPAYERLEFRYAAVCFGGTMLVLWNIWNAARARGSAMFADMRRMWPVVRRSRTGILTAVMAVACIALSPLVSSAMMGGGWYFLAGQCFLAVGALLYPFTPPMVLVLGRSSESTGDAVKALNFALMPYRYVALLPGRRVGAAYLNESSHNLRTPEYARWRDQVEDLEEIAVLIVMDTRELTEHVSYEVASILDRGHAGKTLWVACADGSMPVLEGFRERLGERRIRVVRIEALESWIREFKQVLDRR